MARDHRRDYDDDDDYHDDRLRAPRRDDSREWDDRPGGLSTGWIIGLIGGAVALVVVVVLLVVFLGGKGSGSPEGVFESYASEVRRGRNDKAFEHLSRNARQNFEARARDRGERPADVFADFVRDDPWFMNPYRVQDVIVSPDGQSASVVVAWRDPDAPFDIDADLGTEVIDLVKENGVWKIDR